MISIVTPVWNQSNLTAQYLYGQNIHYPYDKGVEWIIIDNGSTDGTGGILEYWKDIIGPRLKVIKNDNNLGFAKACNQGAERAKGENLLFLNNDIIIQGDYITAIERAIADNPRSLVGAQLITTNTGWNVFDGKPIPYLVGWCLAMPAHIFQVLGGFDERYMPAYYEDIDLCYNASKQGYGLQPIRLPLQHLGEQTGLQLPDRQEITEANRARFAEKWGLNV
jgi:GT2 family glycosyltransferase